jgi:hypothetical protein
MKVAKLSLILVLFVTAVFAADPSGVWNATVDGADGPIDVVYKFKLENGQLTGTATGPQGEMPISDAKAEGEAFRFTVDTGDNRYPHKIMVSGDKLNVQVDLPDGGVVEFVAQRSAS